MPTNNTSITDSNKTFDGSVGLEGLSAPSTSTPPGCTPFVRYAEYGDDGEPRQFGRLHRLEETVPANASFVSAVYYLSDPQVERHQEVIEYSESGWGNPESECIATVLQDECQDDDRVHYPVFAESDDDVQFHEMRKGLKRFVRDVLEVDPNDGKWYFSGGSSLHVHLPYLAASELERRRLKREAERFNEDSSISIDVSNYSSKCLYRLPGAEHYETNLRKLPVRPDSPDRELLKRISQMKAGVFPEEAVENLKNTDILRFSLTAELGLVKDMQVPIVEQENKPVGESELALWKRYNRHPFSPYAKTGNGNRSVIVAQIKGGLFGRRETFEGLRDYQDKHVFVPAYIFGGVGGDRDFTIFYDDGRIKLSQPDWEKWDYEAGDTVVIIGGRNRESRILQLESATGGKIVAACLDERFTDDEDYDGVSEALGILQEMGYSVGSAGKNGPSRSPRSKGVTASQTRAKRLQEQAEDYGIDSLERSEILHVGNRLLKIGGWDHAMAWFREQYGSSFDEDLTRRQLSSIAAEYEDLPSKPEGQQF